MDIKSNIKKVTKGITVLGYCLLVFGQTSCSDFLDVLPMDQVVLENFWKEKADVTSAMNSCYEALADEQVVTRMGVWGELRSENITSGSNPGELNDLLRENLLPTHSMCSWSAFYNVINRCNIVIHYAPTVNDANYTSAECDATIAEATTLRALCYFYLIRTFRDVPYTTTPSIDDNQNYIIPATPFNDVIDSLITDLERVKGMALTRYAEETVSNNQVVVPAKNNSRITRNAIYALLADLYLWKGDWDHVIEYCDKVIDDRYARYEELLQRDQLAGVGLYEVNGKKIPLILEGQTTRSVGDAYTEIFGKKNSFESLFEIFYNGNSKQENNWVANNYGNSNTPTGRLRASEVLTEGFTTNQNAVFLSQKDCRFYEGMKTQNGAYYIAKYVRQNTSFSVESTGNVVVTDAFRSARNANWIIYRFSDILLMKAEALIERGEDGYQEAFDLINTVYKRANAIKPGDPTPGLAFGDYSTSKNTMEDLVLAERHREFLFEGKRWYDLVRFVRRDGETTRLSSNVIRKYRQDVNLIKIKLTDPNYIYFPYSRAELRANPLLKQNPAFNKGEDAELK